MSGIARHRHGHGLGIVRCPSIACHRADIVPCLRCPISAVVITDIKTASSCFASFLALLTMQLCPYSVIDDVSPSLATNGLLGQHLVAPGSTNGMWVDWLVNGSSTSLY
jgi:hypothetical protein